VIHTVGPIGKKRELLHSCYINCLQKMLNLHQKTIVSSSSHLHKCHFAITHAFYRPMLCRAQCCHGKLIICLSVTLRYCCHIVWVSSKINYTYNESSVFTLGSSKGSIPKFQKLQSLKLYFSQLVLSLGGEHIRISG